MWKAFFFSFFFQTKRTQKHLTSKNGFLIFQRFPISLLSWPLSETFSSLIRPFVRTDHTEIWEKEQSDRWTDEWGKMKYLNQWKEEKNMKKMKKVQITASTKHTLDDGGKFPRKRARRDERSCLIYFSS